MLRIYNTLTKKVEEFRPEDPHTVRMFVCGPTVYDHIHIGNARTFVIFDMVAKYLRYRGYTVKYIQNITDIDDKIIDRAKQDGQDPLDYAKKFEVEFLKDTRRLGITAPDQYIRATEHIDAIIRQVKTLMEKGFAYELSDGIYFGLSKFPEYGKLSGRTDIEADDAVSRIDENTEKRNPGDFVLWKRSKDGEPSWPSPWFDGRPGWHIEDTAITETVFGPQYDLHGGGRDLIFPHHEAEIAQMESASGLKPFVRYWLHAGFLEMNKGKMSKSLGNFKTANELLKDHSPETLRLYFLSGHYRSPLDFTNQALDQAAAGIMRISEFLQRLEIAESQSPFAHGFDTEIAKSLQDLQSQLLASMDEDFNTPKAIAVLFDVLRFGNQLIDCGKVDLHSAARILELLDFYRAVLGIIPLKHAPLPEEVQKLVREREIARNEKDFKKSDTLREQIQSLGYKIDDTPYGPLVKK